MNNKQNLLRTTRTCEDENQTIQVAKELSELLEPGDVIALNGNLGAGKTRFVRALAVAAGVEDSAISSPTYMIVQSYIARLEIHHFDLYRIEQEEELYESGCEEFLEAGGACLIEWANRFPAFLPHDHLEIEIDITGENSRQLTITAFGPKHARLIRKLDQPS